MEYLTYQESLKRHIKHEVRGNRDLVPYEIYFKNVTYFSGIQFPIIYRTIVELRQSLDASISR